MSQGIFNFDIFACNIYVNNIKTGFVKSIAFILLVWRCLKII